MGLPLNRALFDDDGMPSLVITLFTREQFSYRIEIQLPDKPFSNLNLYTASSDLHCCAVLLPLAYTVYCRATPRTLGPQ